MPSALVFNGEFEVFYALLAELNMSGVSDLLLYFTSCGKCWLLVYMTLCVVFGFVGHMTLHLMAVGLLICLTCYFRLPPPSPALVRRILGSDPWDKQDRSDNDIGMSIITPVLAEIIQTFTIVREKINNPSYNI